MTTILTLQMPVQGKVLPLATSTTPRVIAVFCEAVWQEYAQRVRLATDEVEAAVYNAELERLRRIFTLACPEIMATLEVSDD